MLEWIGKTRDGVALTREEIESLVKGIVDGSWPDYQLAAWLMAVYLRGLTDREVFDLTKCMAECGNDASRSKTGETQALGEVDKHSTGGVGDKTTLVVAPLVASLGIRVAKMSGRGLGHTGGTLDKLESIPGFQVHRTREQIQQQIVAVGVAVVAQSEELAPADRRLYALRDVTATVDSIPLIASSIMSKKLAGGAPNLVLDVKVGRGAFMPTLERAQTLTERMIRIGEQAGRKVRAVLTNMDQPLGCAIGNAIEVNEAVQCLQGQGPADLREEVIELAAHMTALARSLDTHEARERVETALRRGDGWETFRRWIRSQGGDVAAVERGLPLAPLVSDVRATVDGYANRIDALSIGEAVLALGAGRLRLEDTVDPSVGVEVFAKVGDRVYQGQILARVHAQTEWAGERAAGHLRQAIHLSEGPCDIPPTILAVLGDAAARS